MNHRKRMRELEPGHSASDWIMPGVLLLVGLPCMLIALYMAGDDFLFRRAAQRIPGVVTEITDGTPSLTVEYALAGGPNHRIETFGSDLYEDVKVGDTVGVFVHPAHPEQGRLDYFTAGWMLPMILGIFGSFFGIPGLIALAGQLRQRAARRKRDERGVHAMLPVKADVLEIRPLLTMAGFREREASQGNLECRLSKEGGQWRLLVNGEEQDPFAPHANRAWGISYSVVAQWLDSRTGKTHVCESEPVDTDPGFYLQFGTVTVLADTDDPDNCEVDMGFLPARQAEPQF